MTESTPPLHLMERDQFRAAPTLVVTVKSPGEFHEDVTDDVDSLEYGDYMWSLVDFLSIPIDV